jgi:hypothetical protein
MPYSRKSIAVLFVEHLFFHMKSSDEISNQIDNRLFMVPWTITSLSIEQVGGGDKNHFKIWRQDDDLPAVAPGQVD